MLGLSQDAEWGDDPEVQALCELYGCIAQIWAYDSREGAKTLRTFHEACINACTPAQQSAAAGGVLGPKVMRLSYYG